MKKAIIIGASSGIGRELAKVLSTQKYELGLIARRYDLLQSLQNELATKSWIKQADIAQIDESQLTVKSLIQEMGGVDLFIINAGVGFLNDTLDWEKEQSTIDVNVRGFASMAGIAMSHFLSTGSGHLVGISSIAAIRGNPHVPAYNASKAFASSYITAMRAKAIQAKKPINVLDVKPGFVDTRMAKGPHVFWSCSPQRAAQDIYQAIQKKKSHLYVTKKWRLIAWLLKLMPSCFYDRYF